MTENIDNVSAQLSSCGTSHSDAIIEACRFLNTARFGNPFVKFMLLDIAGGYSIQPIIKVKFKGVFRGKSMVRTVLIGRGQYFSTFAQILSGFGVNRLEANALHTQLTGTDGRPLFDAKDQLLQSAYLNFIRSDGFQREYMAEKKKKTEKLRSRMRDEIMSRFRVMLSLGADEGTVTDLFRQVEIERVLES